MNQAIKPTFLRGISLFVAVLLVATVAPQILGTKTAFAGDGYPWDNATCLSTTSCSGTSGTFDWGYTPLPCPSNDPNCLSYPYPNGTNPTGGMGDTWGYGVRNCTSYVAYKINQQFNKNIAGWGDAKNWNTSALNANYTDDSSPQIGDIAQWTTGGGGHGHVAYVYNVVNGVAYYDQYNYAADGNFTNSYTSSSSEGAPTNWIHIGTVSSGTSSRFALTNGGGALYASDYLGPTLTQESSPGDALKIAVGGPYQVRETGGGQMVWASSPGSSWLPITTAGAVTNVAVGSGGSQGIFMWMDNCGAVWTNNQPSTTGEYEETGCGAKAISAGGNNIAYVDSTNTAYASYTWNQPANRVSNVGDATNIAVSNQGILMMISGCGAAVSNNTFSVNGWHAFTNCGDGTAIATGGTWIAFINGGGTAYGATSWNGQINPISNPGDAHAVSMTDMPRVLMISGCHAANAKDDVNNKDNWIAQTLCNDATAIAR